MHFFSFRKSNFFSLQSFDSSSQSKVFLFNSLSFLIYKQIFMDNTMPSIINLFIRKKRILRQNKCQLRQNNCIPKRSNGESSVKIQRCPATVMRMLKFSQSKCPPMLKICTHKQICEVQVFKYFLISRIISFSTATFFNAQPLLKVQLLNTIPK